MPSASSTFLREYLSEQHIRGWRNDLSATPTDVLDLLQYVQGGDRHKLGEMMATGSSIAQVRLSSRESVLEPDSEPVPVKVVASTDGYGLEILSESNVLLGVVDARDHAGVVAVLDSGLLLDFSLKHTTLTMTRAAGGQFSFR